MAIMPTDAGEPSEATIDLRRKITCGDAVKIAQSTKVFLSGKTRPRRDGAAATRPHQVT